MKRTTLLSIMKVSLLAVLLAVAATCAVNTSPPLSFKILGEEIAGSGLGWGSCTPSGSGQYVDGTTYELWGNGIGVYWCRDRTGFGYVPNPIAGDFMSTARVKSMPADGYGTNGKIGIAVKANLTTRSPVLSLRWDYYRQKFADGNGLNWFNRQTPEEDVCLRDRGSGKVPASGLARSALSSYAGCDVGLGQTAEGRIRGHNFCGARKYDPFGCFEGCQDKGYENLIPGFGSRDSLWLRVRRSAGEYRLYAKYGTDETWTQISPMSAFFSNEGFRVPGESQAGVYVGLIVSSSPSDCRELSARFDNIEPRTGPDAVLESAGGQRSARLPGAAKSGRIGL